MSKVSAIYHIVICTYMRRMTIPEEHKRELYGYIYGILKNNRCILYQMNGIGNHIHLLINLHPSISLSAIVQSIKQSSSRWMKNNPNFPLFESWGKEYFAFSVGKDHSEKIIEYIKNQEKHHQTAECENELKTLCYEEDVEWHDNALT